MAVELIGRDVCGRVVALCDDGIAVSRIGFDARGRNYAPRMVAFALAAIGTLTLGIIAGVLFGLGNSRGGLIACGAALLMSAVGAVAIYARQVD